MVYAHNDGQEWHWELVDGERIGCLYCSSPVGSDDLRHIAYCENAGECLYSSFIGA